MVTKASSKKSAKKTPRKTSSTKGGTGSGKGNHGYEKTSAEYKFLEQIAMRIREMRESKGWSPEFLASKVNCSASTQWRRESGGYDYRLLVIRDYCRAFNITMEVFFSGIK